MQVQCAQCSSRYKLPDDKIRPTGTKVRCPRCQHTFYVYPQEKEADAPVKQAAPPPTPIVPPKRPAAPKPVVAPPPPPPPEPVLKNDRPFAKKTDFDEASIHDTLENSLPDFIESARTVVSAPIPKLENLRTTSPFKHLYEEKTSTKATVDDFLPEPEEIEQEVPQQDEIASNEQLSETPAPAPQPEPEREDPRPFGDATFAEIQNIGSSTKKKKSPLLIAAIVIVFAGIAGIIFYSPTPPTPLTTLPPPIAEKKIVRPSRWYKDDPAVFQDFLTQMATLPPQEQGRPERRALIAEALILNGILTGTSDQISSGLGYASSLIAAYPQNSYGFSGLSTFAFFQGDFQTLEDLVARWPSDNSESPELILAKIITDFKKNSPAESLNKLKALLRTNEDFPRGQAAVLFIGLDNMNLAEDIFGIQAILEMAKKFEKQAQQIKSQASALPAFYRDIDRKIQRKNLLNDSPPSKPEPPKKIVDTPPPAASLPPPVVIPKTPPPPPVQEIQPESKKIASKPVAPNKLPKPDPDLIALNKKSRSARVAATQLYNQGISKLKQNQTEQAIQLFQKALREDPDMAEAYKELGIIYMGRQEKDRALRALKIYLQLKPDSDDKQLVESWITSMQ